VNSSVRQHIFDQHELFQEIETDDPAVDLEVAAVNAGCNHGKIDYELGLGVGWFFGMCRRRRAKDHYQRGKNFFHALLPFSLCSLKTSKGRETLGIFAPDIGRRRASG
jgi:hypothetical protein